MRRHCLSCLRHDWILALMLVAAYKWCDRFEPCNFANESNDASRLALLARNFGYLIAASLTTFLMRILVTISLPHSAGNPSTKTMPNKQVTKSLLGSLGYAFFPAHLTSLKVIRRHEWAASIPRCCNNTRAIAKPGSSIPDM